MSSILEEVQKLVDNIQQHARIRNVETTRKKLLKIVEDGLTNLHVICDFDGTITRFFNSAGEINPSSHNILSRSSRLTRKYKAEVQKRIDYYYPIEMDATMTKEEKTPYMVEWWDQAHELLMGQKINKEDIKGMVAETDVELRPGLDVLINECKSKDIPFLVFSAGLGNVIEQVLVSKNLFHPSNMHIVSNQMGFNEKTGICDHFKGPTIHVFNKSEVMIKGTPYYATIENRGNVILLGDSTGDLQMASGIHHDTCLSVGFLNDKVSNNLDIYLEMFDIVVVGDGSMDVVNLIVKSANGYTRPNNSSL